MRKYVFHIMTLYIYYTANKTVALFLNTLYTCTPAVCFI